jgi:hypothetical protein
MIKRIVPIATVSAKSNTGAGTSVSMLRAQDATVLYSSVVSGGSSTTVATQVCVGDIWYSFDSVAKTTAATHTFAVTKRNFGYTAIRANATAVTGTVSTTGTVRLNTIEDGDNVSPVTTHTMLSAVAEATTSDSLVITNVARCAIAYSCTTGSGDAVTITTSVSIGGTWYVIDATTYDSAATNVKVIEYENQGATAIRVVTSAYTQTPAVTAKIGVVARRG